VKPLPHDRAFEVLPWLVNGTLANAEREAVEEHARTCNACRRELKQQRQLYAAALTRRTADVSVDAGFEQLDRELDATARGGRLRWPIRYTAAAPFAVAAAAGVAVLAVLLWFTPLPELTNRTYSTLATPASENAAMLDIVFAADATAGQMQALLDEIDGEIVAGPSDLGRYRVQVHSGPIDDAQLAELQRALAADPRVRFTGRSLTAVQP
jgi:anti-sigma factor RsiW